MAKTTNKPKAPADYAKLADESEIRRDGFKARADRAMAAIEAELKDHPEAAEVRRTIEFYAKAAFDLHNESATLARYMGLRDRDGKAS